MTMLMKHVAAPPRLYDRVEVAHQQGSQRHTALPSHCKYAWMFEVAPPSPCVCVVLLLRWSSLSHPPRQTWFPSTASAAKTSRSALSPFPPPFFINFPHSVTFPLSHPLFTLCWGRPSSAKQSHCSVAVQQGQHNRAAFASLPSPRRVRVRRETQQKWGIWCRCWPPMVAVQTAPIAHTAHPYPQGTQRNVSLPSPPVCLNCPPNPHT